MTVHWPGLLARWRQGLGSLLGRSASRAEHRHGWVEPSNAITRAIYAGLGDDLESLAQSLYAPWHPARELAPDNVLIAASAPRAESPAAGDVAGSTEEQTPAQPADKGGRSGHAA
jgi:hypothetical protein